MTAPGNSLTASTRASRLSMSRWLVGSSRIRSCGASRHISARASRVFSPPERWRAWVSACSWPRPKRASQARVCCSRSLAAGGPGRAGCGGLLGLEVLDLVLGEEADLAGRGRGPARRPWAPAGRRPAWRRCDLPLPLRAQQRDPVVGVEAQVEAGRARPCRRSRPAPRSMVIMGGAGTLPAGKEKRISGSISACGDRLHAAPAS